ncbi:uncharacterized protein LOC101739838 [Bombyx mori]|uniref:Cuticle protein n=1 Tax=Bombyx mori TaxID=7091 RepID=A0A8R2APJ6_BOMMO|nr:proline-rich extensin-like protein EPR1 [Bombyx mori]
MKIIGIVLLLVFYGSECRKIYKPIDKNANIDFINMEAGGARPVGKPTDKPLAKPPVVQPAPTPVPPAQIKPVVTALTPVAPKPVHPTLPPNQIKPVPVYPTPATRLITTPGPGSVQQLVTFYNSQGKGSVIKPYSYSDAVKQG